MLVVLCGNDVIWILSVSSISIEIDKCGQHFCEI